MSYITNALVRLAGGAETAVRYGLGKLHIVPRAATTLVVTCPTIISSKTVSLVRSELGGDELFQFVKPILRHVHDACMDDSFCKRASLDTFEPIVSTFQSVTVAVTGFAFEQLKDIAILSNLAKGAFDISQWAFQDPQHEHAGLQTLFSLTLTTINLTAGCAATLVGLGKLKFGRSAPSATIRVCNALLAAYAVVSIWGEMQSLHQHAKLGLKACSK